MAEDAFGYQGDGLSHVSHRKNILIFDDINDSGNTLNWIRDDWPSGCLPNDKGWETVWGNNVRVATLMDNAQSKFEHVDYTALEIDKAENPTWIVFPWEGERDYGNF
jgi:hypoxanthine phosphoribosyltransferase